MRNYLDLLDIHRETEPTEKMARIEAAESELDDEYGTDMSSVLTSHTRSMHYRRLHLQYEAMATTVSRGVPQQDSNSWGKRLVEFESSPNELPD